MSRAQIILVLAILVGAAGVAYAVFKEPSGLGNAGGQAARSVPVIAYTVTEAEFVEGIEAVGTLRANESVTLSAQVTEKVTRVNFEDGNVVEKGAVLLEFTSEEESAQLDEAEATLDEAEKQLKRIEGLVANGNATGVRLDEQVRAVKAARAQISAIEARLSDRLLKAPFSGILGFRQVSPGTLVEPGTPVATLDDIDPIKLDFSVPETYLADLQSGLEVEARAAAWRDRAFAGTINAIDSRVDPVTRTVSVRALVPNPEGELRPGMLVTVNVVKRRDRVVLIPEEAVITREESHFVLVIGSDEAVALQEIHIGRRQPGIVEVRSGLDVGERIVAEGISRVRPGGSIRIIGARELRGGEAGA